GLIANKLGQRAILIASGLLEKLGGAANAGKWVLDLVRKHGGERDHRARRTAMGKLPVHLIGNGALLEHHHHMTGILGQWSDMQIDQPFSGIAWGREIDFVFVHRRAAEAYLLDQR